MKILVSFCFVVIAGLGFYLFDLRGELAAARAHVASVQLAEREALAKMHPLQFNVERLVVERDQAQAEAKSLTQNGASGSSAVQKEEPGLLGGLGKVLAMPEMKSTIRRQALVETRGKFAELLKSWGLPKRDEDLFLEMVTDLESAGMEAVFGMLGGKGNAEEAFKKAESAEEETKIRIKSLLGEARYAEWEKDLEAQSEREATASFKEHLATAGLKLPEAQEVQLLKLVQDERRTAGLDLGDTGGKGVSSLSEALTAEALAGELAKTEAYQTQVLQKAVKFLNPDQVNALQAAFKDETATFKLGVEMFRNFLPPAKPTAPGSAQAR